MNKVIIITDSTCDLSKELISQRNIEIVPFNIDFNKRTYADGVDIDSATMYKIYDEIK